MGLRERMAMALSGASQAPPQQQQQQQQPPAVAPAPAGPPPANTVPEQLSPAAAQPTASTSRPSGSSLTARMAHLKQIQQASQAPAATRTASDLPQPTQHCDYREINGRWVSFGVHAAPSANADGCMPQQQQQQQQQRPHDGIDRAAAWAQGELHADVDDFDHDASKALRRAGAAGSTGTGAARKARQAAEPRAASQQLPRLAYELDNFLPGGSQAPVKPGRAAEPHGKRGGTATTPSSVAQRKAAAAARTDGCKAGGGKKGGGGDRSSGRAGGVGRRKAAAPKRKREEIEEGEEEEEDKEHSEEGDNLLDQLLQQAQHQQHQQQEGQQQQQQAQEGQAAPANAPTDGLNEELRLAVDEQGEPWPEGNKEEPYLNFAVPANINRFLRSYQRDGIRFLFRQYARQEHNGGVLADDMGLGKTVQAIGFIAAVLGKTGDPEDAHLPQLELLETTEPLPDEDQEPQWDLSDDLYEPNYARECLALPTSEGALNHKPWLVLPAYPLHTIFPALEESRCYPILVVAPTSVLDNWDREFAMWGKFRVAKCDSRHRDSALAAIKAGQKEVMIVSYPTLSGKLGESILSIPWHMAVFDEAHLLKNSKTQRYKLAARLPTRLRFGLTGTPFQNDYTDMWAVMDFMVPGCLGQRREFMDGVANPIMRGQKSDSTDIQKAVGADAQRDFRAVLEKYLLRRTKKLIADQLPKKMDYVVFCELSLLQLAAYKRLLESPDVELLLNYQAKPCLGCGGPGPYRKCCGWKVEPEQGGVLWPMYHLCECDNPYHKFLNPKGCKSHKPEGCWTKFGRMCPFCLILPTCSILRKISSNHLELIKAQRQDRDREETRLKFERAHQIAELVIGEDSEVVGGYVASEDFVRLSDTITCGKMQVLVSLLNMWRSSGNNKVLLFSNSVQTLNILRSMVIAKGYDHLLLDGSTKGEDRQGMCDSFNNQPSTFIFLISTLAGGVGLNLTAANKVVIFDPSWNPAMDLQAQDRAFRIGQKRDVSVYRLIATGTVEEIIYDRQLYKQMHAEMVLEGNEAMPRTFEGAKTGQKADHGELFGMINLLRHNKEMILTLDLVEQERQSRSQPRIQEYDAEADRAAAQRSQRRVGGLGLGVVADGEDFGLQAFVEERLGLLDAKADRPGEGPEAAAAAVEVGEAAAGLGAATVAADCQRNWHGLLAAEHSEEERREGHRAETELLARAGAAGMLQHRLAFKPSEGGAKAIQAAREAVDADIQHKTGELAAAVAEAGKRRKTERPARIQPENVVVGGRRGRRVPQRVKPLLESMAELLDLSVEVAADRLLRLGPEGRHELRESLARQGDPGLVSEEERGCRQIE